MANVRKKGKKFVGAWIPEELYRDLRAVAADRGVPASDIIDQLLSDYSARQQSLRDAPLSSAPPATTEARAVEIVKVSYAKKKSRRKSVSSQSSVHPPGAANQAR